MFRAGRRLGELTQVVPFELVDAVLDAVLEGTGTTERRLRSLPSRVGVSLMLALGLSEQMGAVLVWQKLVAGWRDRPHLGCGIGGGGRWPS